MLFFRNESQIPIKIQEKLSLSKKLVTQEIRAAKREANYAKLAENPISMSIYRTLKSHLRGNQLIPISPDVKKLNSFFTSIEPICLLIYLIHRKPKP